MALFKKVELLKERPSDLDCLEYKHEVSRVKSRIDRLVSQKSHSIVAYLGGYGVGKSTILKQVESSTKYRWITFEMWRYSNRNELWDAFVIKVIAELTGESEYDIASQLEGKTLTWEERRKILFLIMCGWVALTVISLILWLLFRSGAGEVAQFGEAYLKYGTTIIVPILVLVGLGKFFQLNGIADKRPLRRVFELEGFLLKEIKKVSEPLVIVVEDADRGKTDGSVFLETLKSFLDGPGAEVGKKPFIVIAPQSTANFDRYTGDTVQGLESALKIYDEKIYFQQELSDASIDSLYDNLGTEASVKDTICKATKIIVEKHRGSISIRLLKHALREVNQFVDINNGVNPTIALSIILSNYVEVHDSTTSSPQLAVRTVCGGRVHGSEPASEFFRAILSAIDSGDIIGNRNVVLFKKDLAKPVVSQDVARGSSRTVTTITISDVYKQLCI